MSLIEGLPVVVWVVFIVLCFAAGAFGVTVGRWIERTKNPPQQLAEVALKVTTRVDQIQDIARDLKVLVDDLRDMHPMLTDLGPRLASAVTALAGDTLTGDLPGPLGQLYSRGEGFQAPTYEDELGQRHRSPVLPEPRSGHLTELPSGQVVPSASVPTALSQMRVRLAARTAAELPHLQMRDCPNWIDGCHCEEPAALPTGTMPWGG